MISVFPARISAP